ncbi:MAG: Gfo/Idh/MocA family oxidoreductase [Oscillospiraceae bacterium]|nr:Gfo/Idh/MocA family oxidoreductase [Oscillospiraceae bacterium]
MKKVRWGILGTANIARWCTIPGMEQAENCELYAIAGRSIEKAQAFRQEFGFEKAYGSYDELLEDSKVDAVYIPLPNDLHIKWVKAALCMGKHVLCEKPLAMDAAEARDMYDTARQNGVILMEAYAYLHSPYVESLKKDIADGIIGDIDYIETAFITQGYKEDFRLHKEQGGGAMYDLGCYCTTMILSLVKSEPDLVKASAEYSDLGVDLMTAGLIRFRNGVRASFNVGMILGKDTNARFDRLYIHGSKGALRSDAEYNQQGDMTYRIYTSDSVTERHIRAPQNYALEIEQLGRCILSGEEPHISPEFSIANAELMDRIFDEIGYRS